MVTHPPPRTDAPRLTVCRAMSYAASSKPTCKDQNIPVMIVTNNAGGLRHDERPGSGVDRIAAQLLRREGAPDRRLSAGSPRACSATTPASRRSACPTRAAISSCCPIWARSSGARPSTGWSSRCRACSARRARPKRSSRPTAASPITPGLLRNGVPTAADDHALHGEMPCAEMDGAGLECGADERGPWIAVTGMREYAMGFGAHYRAAPRVVLRPDATDFDIVMAVENLSAAPMDLMYLCHVNFAFADGARIVQPVPFTPEHVVTRTAIPGHVAADRRLSRADRGARRRSRADGDARRARALRSRAGVLYQGRSSAGRTGVSISCCARREGDGFAISWDPEAMPHTIRWILANSDQRVAAFAMPGNLRAGRLYRGEAQGPCAQPRRRRQGGFRDPYRLCRRGARRRRRASRSRERADDRRNAPHRRRRQQHGRSRDLCRIACRCAARRSRRPASRWAMAARAPTRRSRRRKLGASVIMVTKVGDDMFADNTIRNLARFGVDTKYVDARARPLQRRRADHGRALGREFDPDRQGRQRRPLARRHRGGGRGPQDLRPDPAAARSAARDGLCGDRLRQAPRRRDAAQPGARGRRPRSRAHPRRELPGAQRDRTRDPVPACRSAARRRSRRRRAV